MFLRSALFDNFVNIFGVEFDNDSTVERCQCIVGKWIRIGALMNGGKEASVVKSKDVRLFVKCPNGR